MSDYFEIPASKMTSRFVDCYWVFRGEATPDPQFIVPDGRPELIFHLGAPYRELHSGKLQAICVFAGQLTKPLTLMSTMNPWVLGVRFRPDGARAILRESLRTATDRRLGMGHIGKMPACELIAGLRDMQPAAAQCRTLERYIGSMVKNFEPDPLVRRAVDCIMKGERFNPPLEIGTRQFQRRFGNAVGISARKLAAIRRFRSVFNRMIDVEGESWALRALESGYFDQPQMARDFSRFLGCSAREWMRKTGALGIALASSGG